MVIFSAIMLLLWKIFICLYSDTIVTYLWSNITSWNTDCRISCSYQSNSFIFKSTFQKKNLSDRQYIDLLSMSLLIIFELIIFLWYLINDVLLLKITSTIYHLTANFSYSKLANRASPRIVGTLLQSSFMCLPYIFLKTIVAK